MKPSDAKEYKDALIETLDDLKLYKSALVEHPNIGVKKTELMIRANQYFQRPNEDYFVLMNGRHLVAYGYAVQRLDDEWSELGLWVRKSYQGKGCGTQMLRLLVEHAFNNHPSIGVYVIHDFSNISMGKVAERLGFETDWIRERELESEVDIRNKQSGKVSGIDVRQSLIRPVMGPLRI